MVIFQVPRHFIKRWWNSNAHYNSHWLHRFWYRSSCYWSVISSQLLARTCASSSSCRRRSHTFAKCLPNRSKISLFQAGSKDYFWRTFAKFSKRIYDNKENYSNSVYEVKSRFLRTMLICEYGDSIVFGFQKNASEVVYDKLNSSVHM